MHDLRLGSGFLDITSKVLALKEKIENLDYMRLENFCAANNTIQTKKKECD
jgi:hypothetical protein